MGDNEKVDYDPEARRSSNSKSSSTSTHPSQPFHTSLSSRVATSSPPDSAETSKAVQSLQQQIDSIHAEMQELQRETEPIEKERDFYFAKLQKIEDKCQKDQDNPLIKQILDIMFVQPLFVGTTSLSYFLELLLKTRQFSQLEENETFS